MDRHGALRSLAKAPGVSDMSLYRVHQMYREAVAADEAWSLEGQRIFGKRWGDVRYTRQGEGDPGSMLHSRYQAFLWARVAWQEAQA
jgi:hypothetical protein